MTDAQLLADIRDANLTYLMLAQTLIRKDRAEALFRLGLSEDAADMLTALSPAQVLKTASTNMLLCRFRVDDDLVWNLLTDHRTPHEAPQRETATEPRGDRVAISQLHAHVLMAGRFAEAL
jgi:flagellar transcriptional activator FlhD